MEWNAPFNSFPSISGDGRFIAFSSFDDYLVPDDTNQRIDGFVYDRLLDEVVRISKHSDGTEANNHVGSPVISADGWVIIFASEADNLVDADTNGALDIFVHEREIAAVPTAVQVSHHSTTPPSHPTNILTPLTLLALAAAVTCLHRTRKRRN